MRVTLPPKNQPRSPRRGEPRPPGPPWIRYWANSNINSRNLRVRRLLLTSARMRAARVTVVVLCVCAYVCIIMCITVHVCPLISAASHIGITKQRYQRIHRNTGIFLNFADFPKNASFKSYGVICLSRAAPAS